jgi:hypothetical protein
MPFCVIWAPLQIAALGRLALIADSLGEDSTAVTIRDKMKLQLEPYLSGTNPNPFRFDTKYGGITTETGLIDGVFRKSLPNSARIPLDLLLSSCAILLSSQHPANLKCIWLIVVTYK